MKREDVFYNLELSFHFYFKEVFCKKYGFYDSKEKKIQRVVKNKKYQLEDGIFLTDGNGNAELNVYVSTESNSNCDYKYNFSDNTISFSSSKSNVTIRYNVINVDIVSSYPYGKSDDFERQMIAITIDNFYSKPFDVTGKIHRWNVPFIVDMFLFNRTIRNKIGSAAGIMFKSISMPIIDFANNGIINKDGTFNKDFSFKNNAVAYIDKFGNISIESRDMESLDKKKMYSCSVFGDISVNF